MIGLGLVSATSIASPLPKKPKSGQMTLAQNFTNPSQPRPGVYEAAPFTAMVLVPAEIDSKFVVGNRGGNLSMPVFKPELRLIPKETNKAN